jgi:hypothetical protein
MPCKTISLEAVATIGIDIGKNTFHLIGLDKMGAIVLRQKLSRNQVSASKQPAIERPRSRRRGVRARHHARGDRRDLQRNGRRTFATRAPIKSRQSAATGWSRRRR